MHGSPARPLAVRVCRTHACPHPTPADRGPLQGVNSPATAWTGGLCHPPRLRGPSAPLYPEFGSVHAHRHGPAVWPAPQRHRHACRRHGQVGGRCGRLDGVGGGATGSSNGAPTSVSGCAGGICMGAGGLSRHAQPNVGIQLGAAPSVWLMCAHMPLPCPKPAHPCRRLLQGPPTFSPSPPRTHGS